MAPAASTPPPDSKPGLTLAQRTTLLRSLSTMALIAPGEQPTMTMLTGGVSSLIVRVDTGTGSLCVKQALAQLKVAAQWLAPVERNSAEVAWIRLAGDVAPGAVPRILGEDREARVFAMQWLAPDRYPVWKQQLRDGFADPAIARRVARTLVTIHRATALRDEVARAFANDRSFHALRLDPYFAAAAARHPDCAKALGSLIGRTAATRIALMHGDVSPKNILIGPDGPVLLDAECACYGDPAFDLAFCASHLLLKCIWRPQWAAGYLCCHDALVESYLSRADWEPRQTLEARAALLLAGLLLARVDGKSPAEYLTDDADRERVRQVARAALLAGVSTLAEVRERWAVAFASGAAATPGAAER